MAKPLILSPDALPSASCLKLPTGIKPLPTLILVHIWFGNRPTDSSWEAYCRANQTIQQTKYDIPVRLFGVWISANTPQYLALRPSLSLIGFGGVSSAVLVYINQQLRPLYSHLATRALKESQLEEFTTGLVNDIIFIPGKCTKMSSSSPSTIKMSSGTSSIIVTLVWIICLIILFLAYAYLTRR